MRVNDASYQPPDVAAIRAAQTAKAAQDEREPVDHVGDRDWGVPCRIYRPERAPGTLIFAHGGGFVFGDLETHDAHLRRLANRTGWAVVAVDYRRSPEHTYPAAVNDMDGVVERLFAEGTEMGLPTARLAAIGDSAGAKLALVATLHRPALFAALVLVYPFVDPRLRFVPTDRPAMATAAADARWYWDRYLGDHDATDVEVSPIDSPHLGALPPTLIVSAGEDYLCQENAELADRIRTAGGQVTVDHYPNVNHGFWRRADRHPESEASLAVIADFLRDISESSAR